MRKKNTNREKCLNREMLFITCLRCLKLSYELRPFVYKFAGKIQKIFESEISKLNHVLLLLDFHFHFDVFHCALSKLHRNIDATEQSLPTIILICALFIAEIKEPHSKLF